MHLEPAFSPTNLLVMLPHLQCPDGDLWVTSVVGAEYRRLSRQLSPAASSSAERTIERATASAISSLDFCVRRRRRGESERGISPLRAREGRRKRLWGFDANECLAPILYFPQFPSGKGRRRAGGRRRGCVARGRGGRSARGRTLKGTRSFNAA